MTLNDFSTGRSIDDVLITTTQSIEDKRNRQEDITGVPTGYSSLDRITYGWQSTDLVVLAARPSVGKTTFALNLARNAALHPTKPTVVAFFSLEMNSNQIVQRLLSAESEIWLEKIARGKLEEHEMSQLYKMGIQRLSKAPIFIDESALLNISDLKRKCRRLREDHGVELIIVDYLQLMSGIEDSNNREQDLSLITRELKGLSKELRVPIIILSQLSRDIEKRNFGSKIPQLSDLRDSGAIEENADIVMFLYRPGYYDITSNEMGESNKGETYVKIAKHRNGCLDTVKLKGLFQIQKFIEEDYGNDFNSDFSVGGNWKPMNSKKEDEAAKLYIQKGSKTDIDEFDDAPF